MPPCQQRSVWELYADTNLKIVSNVDAQTLKYGRQVKLYKTPELDKLIQHYESAMQEFNDMLKTAKNRIR